MRGKKCLFFETAGSPNHGTRKTNCQLRNKCNHKNYLSSNASLGSNDAQNLFRDEKYVPKVKSHIFGEGEKIPLSIFGKPYNGYINPYEIRFMTTLRDLRGSLDPMGLEPSRIEIMAPNPKGHSSSRTAKRARLLE